jgi:hypothetical protein
MLTVSRSLCWAASLILLAVGNATGLVSDSSATTMFAVIPALWVATIFGGNCLKKHAA